MNASEAEKKVKERWPDAHVVSASAGHYISTAHSFKSSHISDWNETEGAAWLDAAQRMEAEHGA